MKAETWRGDLSIRLNKSGRAWPQFAEEIITAIAADRFDVEATSYIHFVSPSVLRGPGVDIAKYATVSLADRKWAVSLRINEYNFNLCRWNRVPRFKMEFTRA